jgi:hypothetical protein
MPKSLPHFTLDQQMKIAQEKQMKSLPIEKKIEAYKEKKIADDERWH